MTQSLYISIAAIAITSLFASAYAQGQDSYGEVTVIEAASDIYVLTCSYGNHDVNMVAFVGSDGILLVDSGHERNAQSFLDEIRKLDSGEVKYIINTHYHSDHTGGNDLLGPNETIIAHENVTPRLVKRYKRKMEPPYPNLPDTTIADSMTLFFNGDTIRLVHLPNGHTDGDLIVHFAKSNLLCMGDLLFADAVPHIFKHNGGSVDGFIGNIRRVIETYPEGTVIVPGHGRIYSVKELTAYRDMLEVITKRVRDQIHAGREIAEIFGSDILRGYKDWISQEFVNDSAYVLIVSNDMK